MKRLLTLTTVAVSMMLLASFSNTVAAQSQYDDQYDDQYGGQGADPEISYQTFYDELQPYGRWVETPEYGYVWVPDAGPDFRPYSTNGHWVWSDDYEWMWVSDYAWGWAPFHYGRWYEDPGYGWMWVPGYEWSPAWVAWRNGGDYYGWAPLRPGFSINVSFGLYDPPMDYWCFTPCRYITSPRLYDYCVPYRNNITIFSRTTIINNYNYNRNIFRTGPGRRDVERYTGRIEPVRFRESGRPGRTGFRNNEVSMYRPRVDRNEGNRNFAPRHFERADRNFNNGNAGGRGNNFGRDNRPDNGIADGRGNGFGRDNNRGNNGFNRNDNRNSDDAGRERSRPFERREMQQPANGNNLPAPERRFGGFDNRNNDGGDRERNRREMQQPANGNNQPAPERRFGGFDRGQQQQPNFGNNDRRAERRDVFQNRNYNPQPQQPRQSFPQPQRQPQQEQRQFQPRQFEQRNDGGNRGGGGGNGNGGGHDHGGGGGFGRRGR